MLCTACLAPRSYRAWIFFAGRDLIGRRGEPPEITQNKAAEQLLTSRQDRTSPNQGRARRPATTARFAGMRLEIVLC